jgi:hypothetical protein
MQTSLTLETVSSSKNFNMPLPEYDGKIVVDPFAATNRENLKEKSVVITGGMADQDRISLTTRD